jgi:hypothetical protein
MSELHMTHVTEEDLILHYYGESVDERPVEQHLHTCGRCRTEFERLKRVLALVDADGLSPADPPGPAFEREVWARLEPQLARRHSWRSRLFLGLPNWALAGGIAALVLAAFVAGRFSNEVSRTTTPPVTASTDVTERVLVVAVVDHLDRSQMVLLEVLNGDFGGGADLDAEQTLARELVAANRLYRQTAVRTGDDRTNDVLDELERVLVEIANTSSDATKDEVEALRSRIASRGLLFKVRVVHSELIERERQTLIPGSRS